MKSPTLQDDPNVKIPAAVLAAAARSEEMFNQYRDGGPVQPEEVTQPGNPELDAATLAQEPTEQPAQAPTPAPTGTRPGPARATNLL